MEFTVGQDVFLNNGEIGIIEDFEFIPIDNLIT